MSAILADLAPTRLGAGLARGLDLGIGPFAVRVRSRLPELARALPLLYRDYPCGESGGFADFHVRIDRPPGPRRYWRQQVRFELDVQRPFKPLPRSQALPFFEWGLNWCIAAHAHQFVVIHAAAVERNGRALVLPGPPGSGKSTLCAGLVARGWRLLSDELALLDPLTGRIHPIPRPVSLKGPSIDVIRRFDPGAVFGPVCHDTAKGCVAHVRPPADSVRRAGDPATPAWIVLPRFEAGAALQRSALQPDFLLRELIGSTFNYGVLGATAFHALADVVERCEAHLLHYADLEAACGWVGELALAPRVALA